MTYAAVRIMPRSKQCEWPKFQVLAEWADDRTAGNDEPTRKFWEVWFQGVNACGSTRWFIWRIPGLREDWKDFRQRLAERAGKFGLTCVYIYNDPRPMGKETFDMVVEDNRNREKEIIEFRKQEGKNED